MRTLSILFLLAILSCQSSKTTNPSVLADSKATTQQGNALYKPFAEFKGDTLQYLTYNFVEHKEQYIGKTFLELYHDLEIQVKSSTAGTNRSDYLKSSSISLYSVDSNTAVHRMNSTTEPFYIVTINWEKPLATDDYFKLYKASDGNWNPSYEAFLAGQIIKDVHVLKYVNTNSTK